MGQSLLGNPAHFMEQFLDLNFQPSAAFLDAIENIALNARSIGIEQMIQELRGIRLDQLARPNKSKNHVSQPPKGRSRLGYFDKIEK